MKNGEMGGEERGGGGEDGEEDDMEAQMRLMMGFGGFGTTKEKHIPGNNAGTARIEKKAEYRQYMYVVLQELWDGNGGWVETDANTEWL